MKILKSVNSILFQEGIGNFIKRKSNKTFLDNRTLFTINYRDRKTKIYLNKKFGYVDHYIYQHGIYEKDIIDDIFNELTPETTMLDIGSNIGQHSLILAPYCKQIFAFEPLPEIHDEFRNSIKANKYKNIILKNFAVGNRTEQKTIYFNQKNTGASSFLKNSSNTKEIIVKVDLLENLLPKNQKFQVIKMDVEGYEAVVILGNKDIILKNKPVIFLEFSPKCITNEGSHTPNELIEFFLSNNYKIYKRGSQKFYTENSPELNETDNWILKPND